ncbi:hypothetical protein CVM52_07955 [Pseudooceanicola lipolyticus]|uniref:Sulfotransferase domain-containing protein n=1 Tax=Pseudooceanicola lipolyticus TaxID=2029104 RepID=A0A2M8J353_9RHOB|nr:hypothetical protein [Pseudooceanicola lipolyticus]PJE37204.1 hypothetical protein CVM52_07955 [Pseudooceanicola lipolyticus]
MKLERRFMPVWHVASYPRSGNHLVRALLEYATQRPTMGCPGASRDTPIHSRNPNQQARLIVISEAEPIAYKSHFTNQIQQHEHDHRIDRFLLITRDPVEAIASHLARDFGKRLIVTERHIRIAVERELNAYLSLLYAYRAYPDERRYHIRFEDLTGADDRSLEAANSLLRAARVPLMQLDEAEWQRVRAIAKNSQSSLSPSKQVVRDRIRAAVAERISLAEAAHFLTTGLWPAE